MGERKNLSFVLLLLPFLLFVNAQKIVLFERVQRGWNDPDVCPVWNYTNTNSWSGSCKPYLTCSGQQQSPIDIKGVQKTQGKPLNLQVLYAPTRVNLFNTGKLLLLPVPEYTGIFTSGGVVYTLTGLEFHSPSEHKIEGHQFDLEIQFHHTSETGAKANIALLFSTGPKNVLLEQFWSQIPPLSNCSCGNGRVEPWMGEECDEGPNNSNTTRNSCRLNCKWFKCGDGVLDALEECDFGVMNSNKIPNRCRLDCTLPVCGDGVVDENNHEECDDGNVVSNDGCSSRCVKEKLCGNGVLNSGEECDDGPFNSDKEPDACRTNCLFAHCGDDVTDTHEECDPGPLGIKSNSSNTCRTTCTLPICGDGIVDCAWGEQCDSSTNKSCRDCRALCGNNVVDEDAGEECDNGFSNSDSTPNSCRTNCKTSVCGDGVTDSSENCDEGEKNGLPGGRCNTNCEIACGNGIVEAGEQCDDGAANSDTEANSCRTNYKFPSCGDRVTDRGEECDNGPNSPYCRPLTCALPTCGDGILDSFAGEECDDGNNLPNDGCSGTCLTECGNGIKNGNEECDAGKLNSNSAPDSCRRDCTLPKCGDGVIDTMEECDRGLKNGNTPNKCRLNCRFPTCGDGIVDDALGELCDMGELNSDILLDGCSTTCIPNKCRQTQTDTVVDFSELFPAKCEKGFFSYQGSQTKPPCTEGVNWFVYEQHSTISKEQLSWFQSIIKANARPTQPLGYRLIQYPTDDPTVCGNGIRESNEECDDPQGNSDTRPNACRTTCKLPKCGDGVKDAGEECDGGQTCTDQCTHGIELHGNKTVVNMFFKDILPFNHFCCNAAVPGRRTACPAFQ